jgi:hypothetical protein
VLVGVSLMNHRLGCRLTWSVQARQFLPFMALLNSALQKVRCRIQCSLNGAEVGGMVSRQSTVKHRSSASLSRQESTT